MVQVFSPMLGHLFSPEVVQSDNGKAPSSQAYFPFWNQEDREAGNRKETMDIRLYSAPTVSKPASTSLDWYQAQADFDGFVYPPHRLCGQTPPVSSHPSLIYRSDLV